MYTSPNILPAGVVLPCAPDNRAQMIHQTLPKQEPNQRLFAPSMSSMLQVQPSSLQQSLQFQQQQQQLLSGLLAIPHLQQHQLFSTATAPSFLAQQQQQQQQQQQMLQQMYLQQSQQQQQQQQQQKQQLQLQYLLTQNLLAAAAAATVTAQSNPNININNQANQQNNPAGNIIPNNFNLFFASSPTPPALNIAISRHQIKEEDQNNMYDNEIAKKDNEDEDDGQMTDEDEDEENEQAAASAVNANQMNSNLNLYKQHQQKIQATATMNNAKNQNNNLQMNTQTFAGNMSVHQQSQAQQSLQQQLKFQESTFNNFQINLSGNNCSSAAEERSRAITTATIGQFVTPAPPACKQEINFSCDPSTANFTISPPPTTLLASNQQQIQQQQQQHQQPHNQPIQQQSSFFFPQPTTSAFRLTPPSNVLLPSPPKMSELSLNQLPSPNLLQQQQQQQHTFTIQSQSANVLPSINLQLPSISQQLSNNLPTDITTLKRLLGVSVRDKSTLAPFLQQWDSQDEAEQILSRSNELLNACSSIATAQFDRAFTVEYMEQEQKCNYVNKFINSKGLIVKDDKLGRIKIENKISRFHNLSRLLMYTILTAFHKNNLSLMNLDVLRQEAILKMIQRLKQSARKKTPKGLIKTDFFNHTHYNVLFLTINEANIDAVRKNPKDIATHAKVYAFDLSKPYSEIATEIRYSNVIKKLAYHIMLASYKRSKDDKIDNDEEDAAMHLFNNSNNNNNPSSNSTYREQYIDRAMLGIAKLNQGVLIQRF